MRCCQWLTSTRTLDQRHRSVTDALSQGGAQLFAYGTLQFSAVLDALLGRQPRVSSRCASGWRKARFRYGPYPAPVLLRDSGAVDGLIFHDLSEAEWCLIDAFEHDVYELAEIDVSGLSCWAYVLGDADSIDISEGDWDRDAFFIDHLDAYVDRCKRWKRSYVAERRVRER